nr:PREDICTED: hematopoietic prostaglandin D synthase isoform X1 [Rhinolophus sinicus]XP_019596658.1 PREDICTED: hematopoietic prostaglandin D synthase isoform X1 [Rhinolophus sinicus]XP_019596659.1 PREDICTED: hematopoietic prostaglandin D synthase isoform X1 [Rhinolophus sinicus]
MPNYKLIYFNMRGRAEIIRYIFAYLDIKYEDHRLEQANWPEIKSTFPFGKIPILEIDGLKLHQSLAIARYLTKNTDLAGKTELEQCQVDAIVDTLDDFMSRFPWAEKKQDIKALDPCCVSDRRAKLLQHHVQCCSAPLHGLSQSVPLSSCETSALYRHAHFADEETEKRVAAEVKQQVRPAQNSQPHHLHILSPKLVTHPKASVWGETVVILIFQNVRLYRKQTFNELLTYDAPQLLQDLEAYLGEREWFIGNSVTWADFYWEICSTTLLVLKPDLLDTHRRLVMLRKKVQAIPAIADWIQRRPQTKL